MTDAELHMLEASLREEERAVGDLERPLVSPRLALELVGEIRRLRAAVEAARETMSQANDALDELKRLRDDEWLAIVAERIAGSANPYDWQANLDILRKHRDGRV